MSVEHPKVELLSAFLDGAVDAGERAAIASHLEECATCRELVEDLRRVATGVAELEIPEVPEMLRFRIRRAVVPRRRWRLPLAAAATLAAVGLVAIAYRMQGTPAPLPEPAVRPSAPSEELKPAELDKLRSLGYVGGEKGPEPPMREIEPEASFAPRMQPPPPSGPKKTADVGAAGVAAPSQVAPAPEKKESDEAYANVRDETVRQDLESSAKTSSAAAPAAPPPAQKSRSDAPAAAGSMDRVAQSRMRADRSAPPWKAPTPITWPNLRDDAAFARLAKNLAPLGAVAERNFAPGTASLKVTIPAERWAEVVAILREAGVEGTESIVPPEGVDTIVLETRP